MQEGDLGSVPPGLLPQLPRPGREQARGEEEGKDIQPASDKGFLSGPRRFIYPHIRQHNPTSYYYLLYLALKA
jgi:hypothetical protein